MPTLRIVLTCDCYFVHNAETVLMARVPQKPEHLKMSVQELADHLFGLIYPNCKFVDVAHHEKTNEITASLVSEPE